MPNILLADDHDLVCGAIAAYLDAAPDLKVWTASNVDEAFEILANGHDIDLAIFDYKMPGMDGLDGLREACRRFPNIKIALMSGVASQSTVDEALAQGACGYMPKSLSVGKMLAAVREVLDGRTFTPLDEASRRVQSLLDDNWGLSPRELEVLKYLCVGQTNKQIAEKLGVKLVTAKLHVANLMSKMGVDNRTQAVILAKENQLF